MEERWEVSEEKWGVFFFFFFFFLKECIFFLYIYIYLFICLFVYFGLLHRPCKRSRYSNLTTKYVLSVVPEQFIVVVKDNQ